MPWKQRGERWRHDESGCVRLEQPHRRQSRDQHRRRRIRDWDHLLGELHEQHCHPEFRRWQRREQLFLQRLANRWSAHHQHRLWNHHQFQPVGEFFVLISTESFMNPKNPISPGFALVLLFSTFNFQPSTCFAQGSLTPPGAPAPTMKTLAQIEPRTPISSVPFTITQPGSYYLTKNLAVTSGNAIVISAEDVTLDLNGFTLSSPEASPAGTGILLNGTKRNIAIRNGFIRGNVTVSGGTYSGSGFAFGIAYLTEPTPANVRVSGVSVSGCLYNGIDIGRGEVGTGDSTTVESCTVRTVGGYGVTGRRGRARAA